MWPSDRGLPSISEMAAAASKTPTDHPLLPNRASSFNGTMHLQQVCSLHDNAGMVPRITVQEERATNSRRYLQPQPSGICDGLSTLRLRPQIHRFCPTSADLSSNRERGRDPPALTGCEAEGNLASIEIVQIDTEFRGPL